MDMYQANDIVQDFKKKMLNEKLSKIRRTASQGKYEDAMRFIKNITTPWERGSHDHNYIQRCLWEEVQQLWEMDPNENVAPHEWENPYLSDEHREQITPPSLRKNHVKKRKATSIKRKKAKSRKKNKKFKGRR